MRPVLATLREVATKFGGSNNTFFTKGLDEAERVLYAWVMHLDEEELFGPDDPLFQATAIAARSNQGFAAEGFERRPWKSAEPFRTIVNAAFAAVESSAFGSRSFRHMIARRVAKTCDSVAELLTTAQNLGHSDALTTLRSYGQISRERQRALVTGESGFDVFED